MKITALVLFVLMYILMITRPKYRPFYALAVAVIFVAAGIVPVLATVTASLGIEPYLLYFGLLSGATLGGSLTPVGASANITAVGLLRKEGYHVSFGQFMKIGIPYTLAAVMTGYLYFWYIWR